MSQLDGLEAEPAKPLFVDGEKCLARAVQSLAAGPAFGQRRMGQNGNPGLTLPPYRHDGPRSAWPALLKREAPLGYAPPLDGAFQGRGALMPGEVARRPVQLGN